MSALLEPRLRFTTHKKPEVMASSRLRVALGPIPDTSLLQLHARMGRMGG